ncbi:MAG: outer membrane protein [Planctomycetota bacterium]|jgi:opacity protein-like surface antigen
MRTVLPVAVLVLALSVMFGCASAGYRRRPVAPQEGAAWGGAATAPEVAGEADGWQIELIPYLWIPVSVEGDSTVDGGTVGLDLDFDDVMDLLSFGISGRVEAWKGDWGFFVDGMYVDLGGEFTGPLRGTPLAGGIEIDIAQGNLDVGVAYRLLEIPLCPEGGKTPTLMVEPMGGVRYAYLKQEIEVDPPGPIPPTDVGGSEDWVEPLIGARVRVELTEKLGLTARGDMSGFGIGSASDLTWSVLVGAHYRPTERMDIRLGYRYYDIDYSRGSGPNKFGFDAAMHGPWAGVSIRF